MPLGETILRTNIARRRRRRGCNRFVWLVVAWLMGTISLPLAAQEGPAEGPTKSSLETASSEPDAPSEPVPVVRHVGPDTYILLDEEGNPQPFLGMPYETFMKAWHEIQEPQAKDPQGPRYSIDRMRIEGRALPGHAELTARFEITVTSDALTSIPLRLPQAILQSDTVAESDDSTMRITYDESRGGFVAWLQGKANQRRTVTLNLLVPLQQQGSETRLALTCPRGVPSSLHLQVAEDVTGESGSLPSIVTRKPLPKGGTQLQVEGLAGEFELSWRRPDAPAAELAQVLRASGNILVHIDGRSVRCEAQLSVESFGGPFDRFYVRLPQGAALVAGESAEPGNGADNYSVVPLDLNESPPGHPASDSEQWILVRLADRQKGPVEIRLQTEQPLGISDSNLAAELGGFEVLGALRQFGDVNIVLDPNWQVDWELGQYVRRIDTVETNQPQSSVQPNNGQLVATFQYDRQPWNLKAQIAPLASHVETVPNYQLTILPDEVRLRVQFDYYIPGAPVFELRIDLQGWREVMPAIESGGLVEQAVQTADGHLLLQLKKPAPSNAQIVFEARRDLASDADLLKLPLPTPMVDSVAPGVLAVYSAPNLSLAFDKPQSIGISSRSRNKNSPLPPELPGFQAQSFGTVLREPTFVAQRSRRRRQISTDIESTIHVGSDTCQVEQTVAYQVVFEPISHLRIEVPSPSGEIDLGMTFELLPAEFISRVGNDLAELPIPLKPVNPTEADALSAGEAQTIRLQLPQPRMGQFRIRIRYHTKQHTALQSSSNRRQIPLAMPLEGQLVNHRVSVSSEPETTLSLAPTIAKGLWHVERSSETEGGGPLIVNSAGSASMLPLLLSGGNAVATSSTIVQEIWLQTWVSQRIQQNRAVFQFETKQPTISVELPPAISSTDQWLLLLDGQPLAINLPVSGPISVPVPRSLDSRSHTLEVIYREPATLGLVDSLRIDPPLIAGGSAPTHVVWQFVLPSDQHIMSNPLHLSEANSAIDPGFWNSWFGHRSPSLDQAELERRLGASPRVAPVPSENKYVFTGFSPNGTLQLVTARRWVLVLAGSFSVLAIGLLLLYIPALSNARTLAAMAVVVGIIAMCFPGMAITAVKFSALGLVLAAMAGSFKYLSAPPSARRSQISGGSTVVTQPVRSVSRTYTPAPIVSRSGGASSVSVQVSDSKS